MKKILCYVAIVLLIILIILPPALRLFVKDDYIEEVPKDVIELLMCTKEAESINMPYKNGLLTMIKYSFKEEVNSDIVDFDGYINDDSNFGDVNEVETIKSVLENISSTQKENVNGDVTYKLELTDTNKSLVPESYRGTSDVMKTYYTNLGYTCNIIR